MNDNQNGNKPEKQPFSKMGIWVALGAGIGTAIGAGVGNVGVGVALGAGVGTAIGAILDAKSRKEK